jgi:hypothetical protein
MQVGHRPDKKNTDKLDLYLNALIAALPDAMDDDKALERTIFYGVKYFGRAGKNTTLEDMERRFHITEAIMAYISLVTPRRFVEIFPINKEYDGKRWGTKDYFYTVDKIAEIGWDKPIGETTETVLDFLWDYNNWDITFFLVEFMSLMSDMRRAQGQPGIMEQWATENGIQTYTLHTTPDGEQFVMDSKGRTKPVREKRPKHLKLVVPKRGKGN